MKITGHKTNAMFKRYNITDDNDLREAVLKTQQYLDSTPKDRNVLPFAKGASK